MKRYAVPNDFTVKFKIAEEETRKTKMRCKDKKSKLDMLGRARKLWLTVVPMIVGDVIG